MKLLKICIKNMSIRLNSGTPLRVGLNILFFVNEPKLFSSSLWGAKTIPDLSGVLPLIDEVMGHSFVDSKDYEISELSAKKLFSIFGYIHMESRRFVPQRCAALQVKKSVQ